MRRKTTWFLDFNFLDTQLKNKNTNRKPFTKTFMKNEIGSVTLTLLRNLIITLM